MQGFENGDGPTGTPVEDENLVLETVHGVRERSRQSAAADSPGGGCQTRALPVHETWLEQMRCSCRSAF